MCFFDMSQIHFVIRLHSILLRFCSEFDASLYYAAVAVVYLVYPQVHVCTTGCVAREHFQTPGTSSAGSRTAACICLHALTQVDANIVAQKGREETVPAYICRRGYFEPWSSSTSIWADHQINAVWLHGADTANVRTQAIRPTW